MSNLDFGLGGWPVNPSIKYLQVLRSASAAIRLIGKKGSRPFYSSKTRVLPLRACGHPSYVRTDSAHIHTI